MFDLGWLELIVIGVTALIVVGPKELPQLFRTVGRFFGKAKAMEIMVTGRKFSFEESKEMDLVHDIYDSMSLEDFRQDVLDYSGRFTLPFAAAKAIGNIKRSVQSGLEIPLEYHLALERELQSDLFQSNDAKTGIAAYVDKKTPRFEGN